MDISPRYLMGLIENLDTAIWEAFQTYRNVEHYVIKWQTGDPSYDNTNFDIFYKDEGRNIDLNKTLHCMNSDIVLKMAVDMGVETPDFIAAVPVIKNDLKANYKNAKGAFDKAFKQVETDPDLAIGLADTTLESILKHIVEQAALGIPKYKKMSLSELTRSVLKEFKLFPQSDMPHDIKVIGSSLIAAASSIENLRSDGTDFHGKSSEDKLVEDPIYAYFVINSVATLGLFLLAFHEKKFKLKPREVETIDLDELPF